MLCSFLRLLPLAVIVFSFAGCNRFKAIHHDIVYVVAKQTYLRDRVAAVSNRVALVTNGQKLTVLEHSRRFFKVRTEKGEIGWLEEHSVITADVHDQFEDLIHKHAKDPVIATGVLRDDAYLHLKAGRDTDRYYLLTENTKLQLLVRASVVKPQQQAWLGLPKPVATPGHAGAKEKTGKEGKAAAEPATPALPPPPPPVMEDWWLVRSANGDVGWLLAHRLDVDVPDEIAGYSEGQKIVGAYVLQTLDDPEASTPDKKVREYVTVLNAYKDGLPYDFDQVRVFTWNIKKHRYETAYRLRNIEGYLPVTVSQENYGNAGTMPTFSFNQSIDGVVTVDPDTGAAKPVHTEKQVFRLEGVLVRRVSGGGQHMVEPHPLSEREKEKKEKVKKGRHR